MMNLGDEAEVLVSAQDGQSVLERQGGYPYVVFGDGGPSRFQAETNRGVVPCCLTIYGDYCESIKAVLEPNFISAVIFGAQDSIPKLSQHDGWE